MEMRLLLAKRSFFYSLFRRVHWILISLFVVGLGTCWAGTGSISGTITSDDGLGITGIIAQAYKDGVYVGNSDPTTDSGVYTIIALDEGSYTVRFYTDNTGYIYRWYSSEDQNGVEKINATPFDVSVDDTSEINITLLPGESISGQVLNDAGCESGNVEGLWIMVYDTSETYWSFAKTLASGEFTVEGLPSGDMKMLIWDYGTVAIPGSGVEEWYQDALSFDSATLVSTDTNDIEVNFCSLTPTNSTVNLVPVYMVLGLL